MRFEADLDFLFSRDLHSGRVLGHVQMSPTSQAGLCTGSANEFSASPMKGATR